MTALTRSAIPTTYRGTNFRSRLEARWAAFFDLVRWRWTYEPIDADGYIPDFLIHGTSPFYVEVGPVWTEGEYREKSAKAQGCAASLGRELVVLGISPLPDLQLASGTIAAGLFGEFTEACPADCGEQADEWHTHNATLWFEPAVWAGSYDDLSLYHTIGWYGHRPNGHGHEGPFGDREWIDALWIKAGNTTQWRGQPESVGAILHRLAR